MQRCSTRRGGLGDSAGPQEGRFLYCFMPCRAIRMLSCAKAFKKRFGSKGVFMDLGWIDKESDARELVQDLS